MKDTITTRVEQQVIKRRHAIWKTVDENCFYSKNLYNLAMYTIRQEYIKTGKYIKKNDLDKMLQQTDAYKQLKSQPAQQTLKALNYVWKSFFASLKDYSKNPQKYLGRPQLPKYKSKSGRYVWFIKNNICYIKEGVLHFQVKRLHGVTFKTRAKGRLLGVRFVPRGSCYVMEIMTEVEVPDIPDGEPIRIASIDLGINNFATITNNIGLKPIAIKGGVVKSMNQYYNKRKAAIQSELKLKNGKNSSKRLLELIAKRNRKVKHFMHVASKTVIGYCVQNNIDTLVCGYNPEWKQETNMHKKENQKFVAIPYEMFTNQLAYKCENVGIRFVLTEESYTSGTSFIDGEEPIKENYNKSRRKKRGLFVSNERHKINADVNGSYQIMKKVFPNEFSNGIEGAGWHPLTMKVA